MLFSISFCSENVLKIYGTCQYPCMKIFRVSYGCFLFSADCREFFFLLLCSYYVLFEMLVGYVFSEWLWKDITVHCPFLIDALLTFWLIFVFENLQWKFSPKQLKYFLSKFYYFTIDKYRWGKFNIEKGQFVVCANNSLQSVLFTGSGNFS